MKALFPCSVKSMNNLKIIKPDWVVPSNVYALQTVRNSNLKKKSNHTSKKELSNRYGLKFLNSNEIILNQMHSNISIELPSSERNADAAYTTKKKVICSVRTADCMPLLMTDEEGSFVSAMHAGWRGLSSGIIENTVKKINFKGEPIIWIGPHISQESFEVGGEVKDIFLKNDPTTEVAFDHGANGKYFLSMRRAAQIKLQKLGIKNISFMKDFCTYSNPEQFFSYRRDASSERMTSLIWIE